MRCLSSALFSQGNVRGSLVSYPGTQTEATQKPEHPCKLHMQGPHSDWKDSKGLPALPAVLSKSTSASPPTAFSKGKAEQKPFLSDSRAESSPTGIACRRRGCPKHMAMNLRQDTRHWWEVQCPVKLLEQKQRSCRSSQALAAILLAYGKP